MTTLTAASTRTAYQARCHMLIPSAGAGLRAQQCNKHVPKQYQPLAEIPMVAHTLLALAQVDMAAASSGAWQAGTQLVVLAEQDSLWHALVAPLAPSWQVAHVGGPSRAESVMNGLAYLVDEAGADAADWVLVHDAARCLIQPEAVHKLIAACLQHGRGGMLAQPVPDTIKVARQDMLGKGVAAVADTMPRAGKWLAQTPQLFNLGQLLGALRDARHDEQAWPLMTDEASALERMGQSPLLVSSGADNLKVTFPCDFEFARVMLRGRKL